MRRIHVLHPITRLIVGGAQENTLFTAAMLDKARYQVEVLAGPQTGSEGSLIEELNLRGIPLTIVPDLLREVSPGHDLLAILKMAQRMRAGNYDIVHTHSSKAGLLGRIAARLARVPLVVHTVHGWSFHEHMSPFIRNTYIFLERFAAALTDAMVVVSKRDIEKGLRAGIGRPEKYRLIRSAIPLEEFDPANSGRTYIRKSLGIPLEASVLGNVGRFTPQKNPLDWVKVASRVACALPDCRFLLVGDGPLRPQVEALLDQEGIAGQTVLTGLRRDIPEILSAIDVFMLSSLWEGLPRVIPQAMAMQVPVVANQVDGTAEAVINGLTGFLCSPGDLDGMANRCIELLKNPDCRKEMGQQGREIALREFDLRKMVGQITSLYEELLSR